MRLLNVHSLTFKEFTSDIPPYITTSHRWQGDETTYENVEKQRGTDSAGYRKIMGFCDVARRSKQHDWVWIDTCCINKTSSAELTEAINSMFTWYNHSRHCLAYLADVRPLSAGYENVMNDFARSQWFRRGWTLQELLAPRCVVFLTREWEVIGHKCSEGADMRTCIGCAQSLNTKLNRRIAGLTGLPESVLWNYEASRIVPTDEKWQWASNRQTTKPEDGAYCLLGIFGVYMPLIYGEGASHARRRLQQEVRKLYGDSEPQAERPERKSSFWGSDDEFFSGSEPDSDPEPVRNRAHTTGSTAASGTRGSLSFNAALGSIPQAFSVFNNFFQTSPRDMFNHSSTAQDSSAQRGQTWPMNLAASHTSKPQGPNRSQTASAQPNPAQITAAGKYFSSIDQSALASVTPAQISAAGNFLPALDLRKLSMVTPAQIRAAGPFLPAWDLADLSRMGLREIEQRKRAGFR